MKKPHAVVCTVAVSTVFPPLIVLVVWLAQQRQTWQVVKWVAIGAVVVCLIGVISALIHMTYLWFLRDGWLPKPLEEPHYSDDE